MRKIVIPRAGGYGQLKLQEHPDPTPNPDQVRVDVSHAGINFADVVVRQGLYASALEYVGWPITPGFEVAGVVAEHGSDVKGAPAVGTPVIGFTRFGGYASQVCLPAHQVFELPDGFSPGQGAAFPATHFTAYHALFQSIVVRPGMRALVHSAAGGVGTALLQMLQIAGVETVGVVGAPHKVEVAERFGATQVIDKSRERLWHRARELSSEGYDLVLDGNGPSTLRQSYDILRPSGKLVSYGFHSMFSRRGGYPNYLRLGFNFLRIPRFFPLEMVNSNRSVVCFNLSFLFDRRDLIDDGLDRLRGWIAEGKLRPPEIQEFPIERVADAHRALESARTTGKLVLTL